VFRKILPNPHTDYCNGTDYCGCPREVVTSEDEADIVCSDTGLSIQPGPRPHYPVIDIDHPCHLVESSPGRFHLYIDVLVPDNAYWPMISAMAEAGIVEKAYDSASFERGYTAVRHPDRLKP
jgi:hypothetical protein